MYVRVSGGVFSDDSVSLEPEGVLSTPKLRVLLKQPSFFFFVAEVETEGSWTRSSLHMCFVWLTQSCKIGVSCQH